MAGNRTLVLAAALFGAVVCAMAADHHGWGHHGGHHRGDGGHGHHDHGWGWSHPKYKYSYGVKDAHTHDQKEASEWRDGDAVKGHYSLLEPDGHWRTVTYVSDKGGFRAHVQRTGWGKHH